MFSKEVIGSDQFLDLPVSSRELYFQLGMYADDDGFVSPKKVVRMIGASDDDLRVLSGKGFVIPFKSGVVVITHWKSNNYIQSDRYTATMYQEEYSKLGWIHNVYNLDTQERLGKSKVSKEREEGNSPPYKKKKKPHYDGQEMRMSQGKWWVLPVGGGKWLDFAGKEADIEWK